MGKRDIVIKLRTENGWENDAGVQIGKNSNVRNLYGQHISKAVIFLNLGSLIDVQ